MEYLEGMRVHIEHPYLLHSHFVGRSKERIHLREWLVDSSSPIILVDALGGTGKSALSWVWLNLDILRRKLDVNCKRLRTRSPKLKGAFWWSFYTHNTKFRDFIIALHAFLYSGNADGLDLAQQLERIVEILIAEPYLIVADGIERILLAYEHIDSTHRTDNVDEWGGDRESNGYSSFTDFMASRFFRVLASNGAKSRVLLTSRLVPEEFRGSDNTAELIAGIRRLPLEGLEPEACLEFFRQHGVDCHLGEVRLICGPINYHPLYLRLISGYLENLPPDRRNDLSNAIVFRPRDDLRNRQHFILEKVYNDLDPQWQNLLSRIAAFRTIIDLSVLRAVSPFDRDDGAQVLTEALIGLERRGILFANNLLQTYDLHPIVRAFAYSRLATSEQETTHKVAADHLLSIEPFVLTTYDPGTLQASVKSKENTRREFVADHFTGFIAKTPVGEQTARKLALLEEIFYQLVGAKRYQEAFSAYRERLSDILFFRLAAYHEAISLLEQLIAASDESWQLKGAAEQVWALNASAMCHSRVGLMDKAAILYKRAITIARKGKLYHSLAMILQNQSEDFQCQGKLKESEELILESRRLAEAEQDEVTVALSYRLRGFILNITGQKGGENELQEALRIFRAKEMSHPELYVHTNIAWGHILQGRSEDALKQLDEAARLSTNLGYQRDIARIAFLRGKAYRTLGRGQDAVTKLREAWAISRQTGLVEFEAIILVELARSHLLSTDYKDFLSEIWDSLREADRVSRRIGFRLQEADTRLAMAEASFKAKASFDPELLVVHTNDHNYWRTCRREAETALKLAECNGENYRYQQTYTNAERLLAKIDREEMRSARKATKVVTRALRRKNYNTENAKPSRRSHVKRDDRPQMLGQHLAKFSEILRSAFPLPRMDELLLFRLNIRRPDIALGDDYREIIFNILKESESQNWTFDLLRVAREANPNHPGLFAFAQEFGLATATPSSSDLERLINEQNLPFDVTHWRTLLGQIEGQICRVEVGHYPKTIYGTGFLVGASEVMTNYHVMEEVIKGDISPNDVVLRFDYKRLSDGTTLNPGTEFRLPNDSWLLDSSEYSAADFKGGSNALPEIDALDYALISVDGEPGQESIGERQSIPGAYLRGWIQLPVDRYEFRPNTPLYIMQHPEGNPLQLALETNAVIEVNSNDTRVRYRTNTERGSSGSPCFNKEWQLVALHHSGDPNFKAFYKPKYNEGIPIFSIKKLLESRGKIGLLGASPL